MPRIETPIVQFGTSRFLQAHVDLFVSEALAAGAAAGPITVVQTTGAAERRGRVAALAAGSGFPVRIRGREAGREVDRLVTVRSVARALSAAEDWAELCRIVAEEAAYLVSNTGEAGYGVDGADPGGPVPASFPAKLLALLAVRHAAGGRPLTVMPCELVPGNGQVLKAIVLDLAGRQRLAPGLKRFIEADCLWIDSLVDRIVSEPILPVGAVAEPYALWAIADRPGFVPPLTHPCVRVVADLEPYERLKLHILNLGHTVLADLWHAAGRPADMTVRQALAGGPMADALLAVYRGEVLPGFAAKGLGREAAGYAETTLERFRNPFLAHRLSEIHGNHAEKIRRRIGGFIEWVAGAVPLPRLGAIAARTTRA